jgi:hypothetical protein
MWVMKMQEFEYVEIDIPMNIRQITKEEMPVPTTVH